MVLLVSLLLPAAAVLALGLGAVALAVSKRRGGGASGPEPSWDAREAAPGEAPGQLYRLSGTVDPAWVEGVLASLDPSSTTTQAEVERRLAEILESGGVIYDVRLVTADPTSEDAYSFLARLRGDPMGATGPITISSWEPVAEPPDSSLLDVPTLDVGLTAAEVHAVAYALEKDPDPTRLEGFASTMDGDFPIAASLLRNKSVLEGLARSRNAEVRGSGSQVSGRRERLTPDRLTPITLVGDIFDDVSDVADVVLDPLSDIDPTGAIDELRDASKGLSDGVTDMWNRFGGVVETLGGWVPGPQIWLAETAGILGEKIEAGEPIGDSVAETLSDQGEKYARSLRQVSPFVRFVPGLGTGIAMAIDAGTALALRLPLDQAAIDLVATQVPGGPLPQAAFRSGVTFSDELYNGEDPDALAVLRSGMPPDQRVAFDAGVALENGKNLQEAGFLSLVKYLAAEGLGEAGREMLEKLGESSRSGIPVGALLREEIVRGVRSIPRLDRGILLGDLLHNASLDTTLLKKFAPDLARSEGVPIWVARGVLAALTERLPGVVIVDADLVRRMMPEPPSIVANAALKLGHATRLPEASRVVNPQMLSTKLASLAEARGEDLEAEYAARQIERARRALDRANWVEWYRRIEDAGGFAS